VIEAVGGGFDGVADDRDHPEIRKLRFWVHVPAPPASPDTPTDGRSPRA
jgi:hypothetical protein